MVTRSGNRSRRLPRDERRAHFLDVAAELVVEGGWEAVTMEGIASRAGVSKGLGYAYFENREQLLAALFDREMGTLDRDVAAAVARAADAGGALEDQLRALMTASLETIAHRGVLMGALLKGDAAGGPLEGRRQARQRAVEEFLARLVIAEYGVPQADALRAVAFLLGGYTGTLDMWVHRRTTRSQTIDTFVTMAMGGLRSLSTAN